MLIAIIDKDQGDGRRIPLAITDDDGYIMPFESINEIRRLAKYHILSEFQWWAFDVDTGEAMEV